MGLVPACALASVPEPRVPSQKPALLSRNSFHGMQCEAFMENPLVVLAPVSHPMARRERIPFVVAKVFLDFLLAHVQMLTSRS